MIGFQPTEEQALIVDNVAAFARARLRTGARAAEAARALDPAVLDEAHALGLTTLDLAVDVGGHGLGLLDVVLVEEALAWGDPAAPLALGGPHALGAVLQELGTPAQRARWLAPFAAADGARRAGAFAWSEARPAPHAGFATTATRDGDGWVLRGAKAHVHNAGRADAYAVAAQVDPARAWDGVGVFVVPADAPGLVVGPRARTLGLDAAAFAPVALDGVRVDAGARLGGSDGADATGALVRAFLRVALRNAARCAGLARAAVEVALAYTSERVAFGKPVAHFQAVAFALADRHMEAESAALLVRHAARQWDAGRFSPGEVATACATALRAAQRGADDAVQLHGGAGFMRDYLPEKLLRDARTLAHYGATAATLDGIAAATELGVPLDGALALPTPDAQPVFV